MNIEYYSILQKVIELYTQLMPNKGNILMFHDIIKNDDYRIMDMSFSIKYDTFEKLIKYLLFNNKKFKALDDIFSKNNKGSFFITFDDGFVEVYNFAYKTLKSLNIPFAIFVTCNYLDLVGYITKDMLIEMSCDSLCTVGSHTISHPVLRAEIYENSRKEIFESKIVLEELIKKKVEYFAFPYGSFYACSKRDIMLAKECGYKAAFSTINSHIFSFDSYNKYFIPRVNINEHNALRMMKKDAR